MQFSQLPHLWRIAKVDTAIWLASFAFTVVLNVREGLLASVAFALLTTIFRQQRPPCVLLGQLPGTDIYRDLRRYNQVVPIANVKIFRFDSPLMFINAELFRRRLYEECGIDLEQARRWVNEKFHRQQSQHLAAKQQPEDIPMQTLSRTISVISTEVARSHQLPQFIVLDCAGFNYVDATGLGTLAEIAAEMKEIRVEVIFASFKGNVRDALHTAGFYEQVPKSRLFPSVHDAVTFALSEIKKEADAAAEAM